MTKYEATIGIEVHVEVKSKSKFFSQAENRYGKSANSSCTVVDLGYPGTLPTVNSEVIQQGIRAAHLLHCSITKKMHFDRKNYFYPDNPKNYQITQNRTPIGTNGYVEIELNSVKKPIYIEEIHLEEDTCKSAHKGRFSLLDFNRAGVPLIEIVSKPCMHTQEEAVLYLEKLRETLFYGDISDCKIEEGSMRCDANVSIAKEGSNHLGTKCEIKNIGSIRNVGIAIQKEIERQTALLEKGETFQEQTRRFDDKLGDTVLMRVKETGNDYRYFPEPDIPFVILTEEQIKKAIETLPMGSDERRKLYLERGIHPKNVEKLLSNRTLSDYLNTYQDSDLDFVIASNLLLGDISSYLNRNFMELNDTKLTKEKFSDLISKISKGELSNQNAKDILEDVLEKELSVDEIMKERNIQNITDSSFVEKLISKVIMENEESVSDYHQGKDRAIKYLMGQVMKEAKGSINPKVANEKLIEMLNRK